jgi:hypothetical protein
MTRPVSGSFPRAVDGRHLDSLREPLNFTKCRLGEAERRARVRCLGAVCGAVVLSADELAVLCGPVRSRTVRSVYAALLRADRAYGRARAPHDQRIVNQTGA